MKLETPRMYLRSPEPADAQAYTAIHNTDFVLRFNAMQPTTPEWMEKKFADNPGLREYNYQALSRGMELVERVV